MDWTFPKIKDFFAEKKHIKLLLRPLGFKEREYAALQTIAESKKKYEYNWYYNNLLFPLTFSIGIPIGLSYLHDWFGIIPYHKCFLDIIISGSLSLSGINILRSTSTLIKINLDDSQLSEPIKKSWNVIKEDMGIIKNKLDMAILTFTIAGILAYILQVGQLVNGSNNAIYLCIFVFVLIFIYSTIIGRLIFNSNANYLKDEEVVRILFTTFSGDSSDDKALTDKVNSGGL